MSLKRPQSAHSRPVKTFSTEWRDLEGNASYKDAKAAKAAAGRRGKDAAMIWRLIKFLVVLVVIGFIGLVAYAYVGPLFFSGDFAAPTEEITQPVTLEGN
jgi:nucleotide-binding universal stress UspA family protein